MSTVPFKMGFKHLSWNYLERPHGKEAPDGVAVQSNKWPTFMQRVAMICNLYVNVKFNWIEESGIDIFDRMLPPSVRPVTGILSTHQVLPSCSGGILYRNLSCFCTYPKVCSCYKKKDVGNVPRQEKMLPLHLIWMTPLRKKISTQKGNLSLWNMMASHMLAR